MKHHFKILAITLVLLAGGLLSYALVKNSYFPVAKINGDYISYRAVKENAEVTRRLYTQGMVGSNPDLDLFFSRSNGADLIKSSLESLITNGIIKSSVSADVLKQAQAEIDKNFKNSNMASLAGSINTIYGWKIDKFRERILEPQALFQVLSEIKGKDFENWLSEAKNKSSVKIWFLPFEWQEGELVDSH